MTDRSWESGPSVPEADGSSYYETPPLIAYYGPDGQVAYHQAPADYRPPPEEGRLAPDPGWAALREAVWESEGPTWGQVAGGAPAVAAPPPPPAPKPAAATLTVAVPATSSSPTTAHKVVPRPTAAHRISTTRAPATGGFRPSQAPYRIGVARRLRSGFALVLISVVLAGLLSAVLVAIVAGIASTISHAATS